MHIQSSNIPSSYSTKSYIPSRINLTHSKALLFLTRPSNLDSKLKIHYTMAKNILKSIDEPQHCKSITSQFFCSYFLCGKFNPTLIFDSLSEVINFHFTNLSHICLILLFPKRTRQQGSSQNGKEGGPPF